LDATPAVIGVDNADIGIPPRPPTLRSRQAQSQEGGDEMMTWAFTGLGLFFFGELFWRLQAALEQYGYTKHEKD
jgi:hypothetical protein